MRTFFEGERLARIPGKQKAQLVVLAHTFTRFDPAQRYTEKQVNEILAPIHEDVAFWRRALVDYGYLERQDGVYWVRLGSH